MALVSFLYYYGSRWLRSLLTDSTSFLISADMIIIVFVKIRSLGRRVKER
jgi:hypothetical protein